MSVKPRALILNAPGINCNVETGQAFEHYGATADQVHINELHSGDRALDDYQILALPGGFSHGDAIRAGVSIGTELRRTMAEDLNRFVEAGKVIVGICNGFQVLMESGLLPYGRIEEGQPKKYSLTHNKNNKFECRDVPVILTPSRSVLVTPEDYYRCIKKVSVAHGKGRVADDPPNSSLVDLMDNDQVFMRFCTREGELNPSYPYNPNGSPFGITGMCDKIGLVNGLMPHPERPEFINGKRTLPLGAILLKNAVKYVR
jgi:phosphoribosylformylglycinamidine synthase I